MPKLYQCGFEAEIQSLKSENTKLKAERDKAVEQLKKQWCNTCIGCECEPPLGQIEENCKSWVGRGLECEK